MLFNLPFKLENLPTKVNKEIVPCKMLKTHLELVPCEKNCVYDVELRCDEHYIGQTSKCINVRLTQHSSDFKKLKSTDGKRFVEHLRSCIGCKNHDVNLMGSKVIFRHNNKIARELVEAFSIKMIPGAFSDYSITLFDEEHTLFEKFPPI